MNKEESTNEATVPYELTERKWQRIQRAVLRIDPDAAVVESREVYVWDPYAVDPNRPRDGQPINTNARGLAASHSHVPAR
jgi:hypothetical protein